jgi:hypothetical protein
MLPLAVCYLLQSALRAFPLELIWAARRDVDAAYTRVAPSIWDLLHLIFPFYHLGVMCVAIPLVSTVGNPDSNYQFNVLSDASLACAVARTDRWGPSPVAWLNN